MRQPRVILGIPPDRYLRREVLHGVLQYYHENLPWRNIQVMHGDFTPEVLDRYADADGVLFHVRESPDQLAMIDRLRRWGKPVVLIASSRKITDLYAVYEDDEAIGKLAAEYLLGLGHRRLHALAWREHQFGLLRAQSFEAACRRHGVDVEVRLANVGNRRPSVMRRVELQWIRWLKTLELPAALYATQAGIAEELSFAAHSAGIAVPEELAILSTRDDPIASQLAPVPLSGIDCRLVQMGREAAALMHRVLLGDKRAPRLIKVSPGQVVVRRSTDSLVIPDPLVASAVRYAREHALEEINVQDVLSAVPAGRRSLERGFRKYLGRSIMDEISRVRVNRAKGLLADTDMDLWAIAESCGFRHRSRLYAHFRQHTGMTPRQFRIGNAPKAQRR